MRFRNATESSLFANTTKVEMWLMLRDLLDEWLQKHVHAPAYEDDAEMHFEIEFVVKRKAIRHSHVGDVQRMFRTGSIMECLERVRAAGGDAWDKIEDPDAYIREMRGL